MKTEYQQIVEAAPSDWPKLIEGLTLNELYNLADALSYVAQRAVYLARYLDDLHDERAQGVVFGPGKLARAKIALIKVRRALGYSYPKNHPLVEINPWEDKA